MTLAGKAYFDAVSKVGENAVASPVSRELGEFHVSPGHTHLQQVKSPVARPEIPHLHFCVYVLQNSLTFWEIVIHGLEKLIRLILLELTAG